MVPPIETLSTELIEMIINLLELKDVGSLRLAGRNLSSKASVGHYLTSFKYKSVNLTIKGLQDMVYITSHGYLGRCLEHCTITGIVGSSKDENADDQKEHLRLLTKGFDNLKQRYQNGGISSLFLRVAAMEPDDNFTDPLDQQNESQEYRFSWRPVLDVATSTFYVTMLALEKSELLVNGHLDIYGSVRGCSLDCKVFQTLAENFVPSTHMFRAIKKLTLRLSAPPEDVIDERIDVEDDNNIVQVDAAVQRLFQAEQDRIRNCPIATLQCITRLLESMPGLENLDLHWYHIGNHQPGFPASSATGSNPKEFLSTTNIHLQSCTLRGFYVTDDDLLQFLKAVKPTSLTLMRVALSPDNKWDKVFEYLTDPGSPIREYHLDDVSVRFNLVHYENVPGTSKFRYRGGQVGPSTLTRRWSVGQVKKPIHYRFPGGGVMGSSAAYIWNKSNSEDYGWPHLARYDFVTLNLVAEAGYEM